MFLNYTSTINGISVFILNRKHEMFLNIDLINIARGEVILNRKHEMFLNTALTNIFAYFGDT